MSNNVLKAWSRAGHICCIFSLSYSLTHAQPHARNSFWKSDSLKAVRNHSCRIVIAGAPGFYTFSKLGIDAPLNRQPSLLRRGSIDFLDNNFEFGLGFRSTNVILTIGPFSKTETGTSDDELEESDSLKVTGQYHLISRGAELLHSWYYKKPSEDLFFIEVTPLLGYAWFRQKYAGQVRNLKINKTILDFRDRTIVEGVVLGGQVSFVYPLKKRQQGNKLETFAFDNDGLIISLSSRNFEGIQQFALEAGWIRSKSANNFELSRFMIFARINEIRGNLHGRNYNIGIRSNLSLKELFSD